MKGIVFTTLFDMLEEAHGLDFVDQLIDECELPSGGAYTAVGTYSHEEIVTLVGKICELTESSPKDVLNAFGAFLFLRLADAYPDFINRSSDLLDFLENVETYIHVEVKKLYPEAELPRFECQRPSPNQLQMIYSSVRHFEDLCEGLLLGAVDKFKQPATIERQSLPDEREKFLITLSV